MASKIRYEVFEDNGGGITMFVLDADGTPIWGHSGYEYAPEGLKRDIAELEEVGSVDGWDGNGMYDGSCFTEWGDGIPSLQDTYDELSDSEWVDLIADNDGAYPGSMGANAKSAFGLGDDEDE